MIRDPLVQFLIAGAALFILYGAVQSPDTFDPESTEIFLPAAQIELISANFARTWSRPPTTTELRNLIDSFVREEIFYREALALGLDKNDATVRRRMQQKLAFTRRATQPIRSCAPGWTPTRMTTSGHPKRHSSKSI